MRIFLILLNSLLASLNVACVSRGTIKSDEAILLYDTSARLVGTNVIVPVHGHVFEPYDGLVRSKFLRWLFENNVEELESLQESELFESRISNFLVDNERGKRFKACLGNNCQMVGTSKANGRFEKVLNIPLSEFVPSLVATHPKHRYSVRANIDLVRDNDLLIISDIDDTVKLTDVSDKTELLKNTFSRPFSAIPGMAEKYQSWAKKGAKFIFVSSSPWQLYNPLQQFFDENNFPKRSMQLKDFRLKDSTLFNLFKGGDETKPPVIEKILRAFPFNPIVLVGDNGEEDPFVYQQISERYPHRVKAAFIRRAVANTDANELPGIRYFDQAEELPSEL